MSIRKTFRTGDQSLLFVPAAGDGDDALQDRSGAVRALDDANLLDRIVGPRMSGAGDAAGGLDGDGDVASVTLRTPAKLTSDGDGWAWDAFIPLGNASGTVFDQTPATAHAEPVSSVVVAPPVLSGPDWVEILPRLADDDFILSKDADLPLVLPGTGTDPDADAFMVMRDSLGREAGLSGHMLTLDPDGALTVDTGFFGHVHDDWLF
ncbi:hypothetical protein [Brevundimonas sp.]|uniref:hypothetical protein n=1 Tax=Brevundimonas sp. TaxID=1871086 RepID=UPI002D6F7383|nr:hypothetical protein [Brevundimonas sp.]HYC67050.1 hypothetical protein [Brevundimonas sp.]